MESVEIGVGDQSCGMPSFGKKGGNTIEETMAGIPLVRAQLVWCVGFDISRRGKERILIQETLQRSRGRS